MTITAAIAAFATGIRYDDIPPEVVERGKAHILDCLGLALAGAAADTSIVLRDHVSALDCRDASATVLGTAFRTAPRFAALLNATAMHADNFDDTGPQAAPDRNGGIHASAAVFAAALAAAEQGGASGSDLMTAYHVGVEVACKLNHAIDARHYEGGFHVTGTLNTFGAVVAAGRLSRLSQAAMADAIAVAASQAAGVRANFGTMAEAMHPGHAAECGVVAADLAVRGLKGAPDALDGGFGYLAAAGGGFDSFAIVGRLGVPWAFTDPGMWIKPYPSGALTHPALGCLLDLVRTHDLRPAAVRAVRVQTNRRVRDTLIHDRPRTALEAKFSLPFGLALALHERRAGLAEFTDAAVSRPELRATMEKIAFTAYDHAAPDYTNVTTLLEIDLEDGRRLSARADYAKGSTRLPMTFDEVFDKFLSCAAAARCPEAVARDLAGMVRDLDRLGDIRTLTVLAARPGT
jgi:2-methylcitrate dehydratase PrpD